MKLTHVVVASVLALSPTLPMPRASADKAPLLVTLNRDDDAAKIVREVARALPIKHRFLDEQDEVLRVVNDPPAIVLSVPTSSPPDLLARVAAITRGDRLADTPHAIDFSRTSVTVERRNDPIADAAPTSPRSHGPGSKTAASGKPQHPQFPNATDRLHNGLPAGTAPNHANYLIVLWNPYHLPWANAERTLDRAAQRGLLTEPSFDDLLVDDRLVPTSARAELVHEFELQLRAGVIKGWLAKNVIWRHDDVATFEALRRVRTAAYACAAKLGP